MKTYAIISVIGLVTSLSTANVSQADTTNIPNQTITVPYTEIEFDRGNYEIVSIKYDRKYMLSDQQLISILKDAGFRGDGLKMAWAIAVKESTRRPMALNKSSNCYGLFQINMTGSMGPDRREKYGLSSNEDLYNPLTNAIIAYKMSNGGTNWSAWSTENSAKRFVSEFPY